MPGLPNASEANERRARCWLGAYPTYLVEAVSADEVVISPKGNRRGWGRFWMVVALYGDWG
jgi:hypothetical protein